MAKIQTCSTEHADRPMDLKTKIRRYESWIDDQLKEDLRKIETSFRKVNDEITELSQLKNTLIVIKEDYPNGFKTKINIGCNVFAQANVTDAERIYIDIGLGHYLEFTIEEAIPYLNARLLRLDKEFDKLREQLAEVKAHIKMALLGIQELQKF